MISMTCCFIGHRRLPKDKIEKIVKRLDSEVENLIRQGVTDFISGGTPGFDQIAAALIVAKKELGRDIRLIFALPCKNQDEYWNGEQKKLYRDLLAEADEIIYVSEEDHAGCMKTQKRYMIDRSGFCICALPHPPGSMDQTVKYAFRKGLRIINAAD